MYKNENILKTQNWIKTTNEIWREYPSKYFSFTEMKATKEDSLQPSYKMALTKGCWTSWGLFQKPPMLPCSGECQEQSPTMHNGPVAKLDYLERQLLAIFSSKFSAQGTHLSIRRSIVVLIHIFGI